MDSDGALQWSYRVSQLTFFITNVIQTAGGYVILGAYAPFNIVFKMDESGNVLWVAESVGGLSLDLVLTDAKGNEHSKSFDGVLNGYVLSGSPSSIASTSDGGFVLGGTEKDWFWIAKFAPESETVNPSPSSEGTSALPQIPVWMLLLLVAVVALAAGALIGRNWKRHSKHV